MSSFQEDTAPHQGSGAQAAFLLLNWTDHTVLAFSPALPGLLTDSLLPGQPLPENLLQLAPGEQVPSQITLHGRHGPVPYRSTPLKGLPRITLLQPEHQFSPDVLDLLPVEVGLLNAQGQYLYLNPAAVPDEQLRRYLVGRTDREYLAWRGHDPERASEREHQFQRAAQAGHAITFTETYPGEGRPYTLRRTYQPLFREDEQMKMMLGYGEQLTDRRHAEEMSLLRTMADTSVDPLLVLDARLGPDFQRVVYANPAMLDLLRHHGLEELPTQPIPEWPMAHGNGANVLALLGQLPQLPGGTYRDTLFLPEALQWLEVQVNAILDTQGRRSHWAVSLRDVTTQRRGAVWQERIARAQRLALAGGSLQDTLGALLEPVDDWEVGWQVGAVIPSHHPRTVGHLPTRMQQHLLRVPHEDLERHWQALDPRQRATPQVVPDLHTTGLTDALHNVVRRGARSLVELPLYGRDGQLLGALLAVHEIPHAWTASILENLNLLATTAAILIEQHLTKENLERLAYRDPLTGLLNRAALTDWAAAALRQHDRLALGLMDLDRFRFLNDGFGHPVGDQLLRELAGRLCQLAHRHSLPAVARMGGDEFGLLARPEQIQEIAADLHSLFEQPFEVHGTPLLLEASIGWSLAPDTAQDAPTMLQQADAALYDAKRSQVFSRVYCPAPPARIPTVALESALRESLRDGHFRLVYQPQVHLRSGILVGAEALLRWSHPNLGPVPPDQFIPVAELAGLMPRLGEWVLRAACQEAARWNNAHLSISVNVSSGQLSDPTFNDRVRQALTCSGLMPGRLVLEVTESGLIDNPVRVREVLQDLRTLGVRISMDDFGTGYSSLFTLRSLPVDELKIDRAFVRDLGQPTQASRESQAIVSATVLMARALNIDLLAEGVETHEQQQALIEAGCDLGQGWLYARPMDPANFDEFEQSWPSRLDAPRALHLRASIPLAE